MYLFFGSGDAGCYFLPLLLLLQLLLHSSNFTIAIYSRKPRLAFHFHSTFLLSQPFHRCYIHNMPTYINFYLRNVHIFKTSHPCNKHHHRLTFLYEYIVCLSISLYSIHYNNKKYTHNIKLLLFHKYFHGQTER